MTNAELVDAETLAWLRVAANLTDEQRDAIRSVFAAKGDGQK